MLQLINHIVGISSRRDRTEISEAMVDAIGELFAPRSLTIYRAFTGSRRTMLFDCAGIGPDGPYVRNAYLPETEHCFPIDSDPLLLRAKQRGTVVSQAQPDGANRLVFPIAPVSKLLYLIEINISGDLSPHQRTVLLGLVEYCSNHIALLDYGETDTLTGLANRKTFDKHLFEVLGHAAADEPQCDGVIAHRRKGSPEGQYWLAVSDIDHFKAVNDAHGHLIGDEVLVMFARLMRENFRFQDQVFRLGGEEFVAVLQPTSREDVYAVFDRFRASVESQVFSRVGHITVSVGYSRLRPNDTPSDVIDRADEALFYVKQHGRNGVACYEELVRSGRIEVKTSHTGAIELF